MSEVPAPIMTALATALAPFFQKSEQPFETVNPLAVEAAGILRARRARTRFFPAQIFAEPAWDMLLDLYARRSWRTSVSSLCIAAAVPPTTALSWIKRLTDLGLLVRERDPGDQRRAFVELAPATAEALDRYFAWLGEQAAA